MGAREDVKRAGERKAHGVRAGARGERACVRVRSCARTWRYFHAKVQEKLGLGKGRVAIGQFMGPTAEEEKPGESSGLD
ncbi:hypothetical protein CRG98_018897 [Punica granatum]|uniref:Uncharacterized protein n=1 Tax=Punica granatum TaxID=22663 RepID=A0A2I0JWL3_PUNGR|nr:hypothetical protein CRG98_018897 [Punica granatum]